MTRKRLDQIAASGQLDEEAAGWCSRMHGPEADRLRPEFEAWLRRGALHRQAYNKIEEVYLLGAKLPARVLAPPPERGTSTRGWRTALVAGGATIFLGAITLPVVRRAMDSYSGADVEVALLSRDVKLRLSTLRLSGEAFRLADGSVVDLGPDSEVAVDYGARSRHVRLARGRSRFDVAREARPFVVDAGGGSVTARGTSFDVAVTTALIVTVKVRSGEVDVRTDAALAGAPAKPLRRLTAGDELTFGPGGVGQDAAVIASGPVQPGTVGELIAEANKRAGRGPTLRLEDPDLAGMRLGGEFLVHEPSVIAGRLALMLDLAARRAPGEIVLQRRR
jgi:transmembrane sensor